jgi:hypothetical protein
MIKSIAIAIGLTFGLGLLFAAAILLANRGGGGNNNNNNQGGSTSQPCQFAATNAILTVYQAPVTDATQEKARLSGTEKYPVIKQRVNHLLIQLRDESFVWADRRDGKLEGRCGNIPVDDTPLTAFPTLCTFTNVAEVPLYTSAALSSVISNLPPGTYPLIGFNRDRYYLYLDVNQGGWILGSAGQLQGNCVMLPARPG